MNKPDLFDANMIAAEQVLKTAKQSIADKLVAGYVEQIIPCPKGYKVKLIKKQEYEIYSKLQLW